MPSFGQKFHPIIAHSTYHDGEWSRIKFSNHDCIKIPLISRVLHYGESVFEGMKAYFPEKLENPFLFRPNSHYKRLINSSKRIGLPEVPKKIFDKALKTLVNYARDAMQRGDGQSLYLRPMLFAIDQNIALESSKESLFAVLASPCDLYYSGSISVLIERELSRAVPGGTGNVKASSNYASCFIPSQKAKILGYDQILWLDSEYKKYIEELTAMNLFMVINNELITPKLSDTILPGITRDTIIAIAKAQKIKVREEKIDIDYLIKAIKSRSCTELFACGTGSGIVSISILGEKNGFSYVLPKVRYPMHLKLKKILNEIQTGLTAAPKGWCIECPGSKKER